MFSNKEIENAVLAMEDAGWLETTDKLAIPEEAHTLARAAFRLGYERALLDISIAEGKLKNYIGTGVRRAAKQYGH